LSRPENRQKRELIGGDPQLLGVSGLIQIQRRRKTIYLAVVWAVFYLIREGDQPCTLEFNSLSKKVGKEEGVCSSFYLSVRWSLLTVEVK